MNLKRRILFFLLPFTMLCMVSLLLAQSDLSADDLFNQVDNAPAEQKVELVKRHLQQLKEEGDAEKLSYYLKRLDRAIEVTPSLRVFKKEGKGLLCLAQLNPDLAIPLFEDAIKMYKDEGDRSGMARCYQLIGIASIESDNLGQAMVALQQANDIYIALKDNKGLAATQMSIGLAYEKQSLPSKAIFHYKEALQQQLTLHNDKASGALALTCARLSLNLGIADEALAYGQTAWELSMASKNCHLGADAQLVIAKTYQSINDHELASEAAENGINQCRETGDVLKMASLHAVAADAQRALGQMASSNQHLQQGFDLMKNAGFSQELPRVSSELARLAESNRNAALSNALYKFKGSQLDSLQTYLMAEQSTKLLKKSEAAQAMLKEELAEASSIQTASLQNQRLLLILALAGLLAFGGFLFYMFRKELKSIKSKLQDQQIKSALMLDSEESLQVLLTNRTNQLQQSQEQIQSHQLQYLEMERQLAQAKNKEKSLTEHLDVLESTVNDLKTDLEAKATEKVVTEPVASSNINDVDSMRMVTLTQKMQEPLSIISKSARELLKDTPAQKRNDSVYRELCYAANDLLVIINDLLSEANVETSKIQLAEQPFDALKSLTWLQRRIELEESLRDRVTFDLDDLMAPALMGDGDALVRMVALLAYFTIERSDSAKVEVSVSSILRDGKCELQLQINDNAGQMSDAELEFCTKETEEKNESLHKAHRLIELKHGNCTLINTEKGIQWNVNIPYRMAVANEKTQDFNALIGARILIVEDMQLNRTITKNLLEKHGMIVTTAIHGEEALEKMSHTDFDIVLMDLMMPVMDGYKATKEIRGSDKEAHRNLPIIALTASSYVDETEKARMFGMTDYLGKPFSPDELLEKMSHVWDKHLAKFGVPIKIEQKKDKR